MSSERPSSILLSNDKENTNKLFEKNESVPIKSRNPLLDINKNASVQNQNSLKRIYSKRISKVVTTRSSSATEIETQQFFYCSEVVKHFEEEEDDDNDDVFLEDKFIEASPEIKSSLEKIAVPEIRIMEATKDFRKAAQKVTLARKLSSRQNRSNVGECYQDGLYDEDYFEDNYKYMLELEKKFVYRRDFLKERADEGNRILVVNWLHYVHQMLHLNEHTYLAAVRMFDYILISTKLHSKRYVLIGVVCLWLANKNYDSHYIKIPKLVSICSGSYPKLRFIQAEKEVLKVLRFTVNFPEPATLLFYYLKREKLESNQKVRCGAMFLLELFTLLLDFSATAPSVLASVAIMLTLMKYKVNNVSFLEYIHCHLLDRDIFLGKTKQMGLYVQELLGCRRCCVDIVEKYSKEENCAVALNFLE